MLERILRFVKYNNAFTIIFVLCFFSFSAAFAANEDLQEALYASAATVINIDNSAILSVDLSSFNFELRINEVKDDEKNYYASYSYLSFVIEDGRWVSKEIQKTLTVSKEALDGKDLGLYIAEELGENINAELAYLKRVQKLEKEKGESEKVVTVEYSGLIGKMLDPKTMEIEGYDPVIPEPEKEVEEVEEYIPNEVIVSTPPEVEEETRVEPSVAAPLPEEMIDEELVQEVVEELLEENSDSITEPEEVVEEVSDEPEVIIEETPAS